MRETSKAVILAAGRGTRLEPITRSVPKCMAEVAGVTIIDRMLARLAAAGITEVIAVTGYKRELLMSHLARSDTPLARDVVEVFNPKFAEWGNFYSLLVAEEAISGESFIRLDGDVVLDGRLLPRVLEGSGPMCLAIDCRDGLGDEEMKVVVDGDGAMTELSKKIDPTRALGEFVGIERVDARITGKVFAALRSLIVTGQTDEYYEAAYQRLLLAGQPMSWVDVSDCQWTEIDTPADLAAAEDLVRDQKLAARAS